MGKRLLSAKDIVRNRSEGFCERCKVILTRNVHGVPDGMTARSVHHRQPRRHGGKDSVICMVNLCLGCHKWIHDNEEIAALDGWIVIDRFPGNAPFNSWRGWVLPQPDGSLTLLDFERGHARSLAPVAPTTQRHRVATRSRPGHRKSRKVARAA